MKTFLILIIVIASTVNLEAKTPKLIEDPAGWMVSHNHRKMGHLTAHLMKIDFNVDLGKGKRK